MKIWRHFDPNCLDTKRKFQTKCFDSFQFTLIIKCTVHQVQRLVSQENPPPMIKSNPPLPPMEKPFRIRSSSEKAAALTWRHKDEDDGRPLWGRMCSGSPGLIAVRSPEPVVRRAEESADWCHTRVWGLLGVGRRWARAAVSSCTRVDLWGWTSRDLCSWDARWTEDADVLVSHLSFL